MFNSFGPESPFLVRSNQALMAGIDDLAQRFNGTLPAAVVEGPVKGPNKASLLGRLRNSVAYVVHEKSRCSVRTPWTHKQSIRRRTRLRAAEKPRTAAIPHP